MSPSQNDAPGLLAQSRLNPEVIALMTQANRFCAMRGKTVRYPLQEGTRRSPFIYSETTPEATRMFTREAEEKEIICETMYFGYSPLFSVGMAHGAPRPQEAVMARRLSGFLLRDELWTEKTLWRPPRLPFSADFVFRFADTFPGVSVSVCPTAHEIRLNWINTASHADRTNALLFDPVGPEVTAFIKECFPGDADAQALVFAPRPAPPSLPPVSRPPGISVEIWERMTALKPGMTRADLLQLFETEGGMSSPRQRIYIMRNRRGHGLHIKINAEFAPAHTPLLWRGGKGFVLSADAMMWSAQGGEMPTDIIIDLTPLYLGLFYGGRVKGRTMT